MAIKITIKDALKLAIDALDEQASETYEGSEREDPQIAKWIRERELAINLLNRQLKVK